MKMIIADFQESVGTLATKYSDFEFKIDIKGGSFSSVADPAEWSFTWLAPDFHRSLPASPQEHDA